MLDFLKGKHQPMLGVDISSNSVKILEMGGVGDKHLIKRFAKEIVPVEALEGNLVIDVDALADCIRSLISKYKITTKSVALAVPDSTVISKVIQMNDGLSDTELEELVILEADKYIPYAIDEINIDFTILGHSSKNASMIDVLIVASRSENVNKRVEAVNKAGLQTKIVDVESFAIERVLNFIREDLPAEGQDKIIAVIDIGVNFTHLFVLEGMKIVFTREEAFGAQQLMQIISQHYSTSIDEAKVMLESQNFPEDYQDKVEAPFVENLLIQIKRTLQFFYSTSNLTYVDCILLAGGMARVPKLAERVEKEVGISTTVANPFKNVDKDIKVNLEELNNAAPSLLIAIGLALRHIE